jgi:hypothetical protein
MSWRGLSNRCTSPTSAGEGHGDDQLDAAQGLERLNNRRQ